MAGGVDAPVKAIQAADPDAVGYRLAAQPGGEELPARHDTVLALGEPSDHDIRTLGDHDIRTLVAFYVYRTYNLISVGHADQDGCRYCAGDTRSVMTPCRTARQSFPARLERGQGGPRRVPRSGPRCRVPRSGPRIRPPDPGPQMPGPQI